jgi:hypothetical protein
MTCPACGEPLHEASGDECVERRQAAPANAPAHDAMCDDERGLRCLNVMCTRFAVLHEPCEPGCPGYLYPCASDCDESRPYVERCDLCHRFELDEEAARFLAEQHDGVVVWACLYDQPDRWAPAVYPWPAVEPPAGGPFYIETESA